jgi:hypothetical protein
MAMGKARNTRRRTERGKFLRLLATDTAAATAITLVVGLVLASLSAAGVITMALATILLLVAWVVGLVGVFLIKPIGDLPGKHKAISLSMLAVMLFGVWLFELSHQPGQSGADNLYSVIGFQCTWSMPPTRYREDRQLSIVEFQGIPINAFRSDIQIAGPMRLVLGSDPIASAGNDHTTWYRCDATNYGNKTVRDMRAHFPAQVMEAVKTDKGNAAGKILAFGYALTPDMEMQTGSKNVDFFYFHNTSPAYVVISYPTTAELLVLGESQKRVVQLVPPSGVEKKELVLWPAPTNPPAVAPPIPAQPNKRSKK